MTWNGTGECTCGGVGYMQHVVGCPALLVYHDTEGNDLRATDTEDLISPSMKYSLCRGCGIWYEWDELHVDEIIMPGGGCLRQVFRYTVKEVQY